VLRCKIEFDPRSRGKCMALPHIPAPVHEIHPGPTQAKR